MIDFRYHVVSIVAVFLALALGLFIGSTSLRPAVAKNLQNQVDAVRANNSKLKQQASTASSQVSNLQAFEHALEPYAVTGRLTGTSVVVISAPSADDAIRSDITTALTMAGATIAGDVRLKDTILDPQQEQFLATLVNQVVPLRAQLPGGTGAERALALLADVLVSRDQHTRLNPNAIAKVMSAYGAGKLVSVQGSDTRQADLAVLISAAAPTTDDPQAQAAANLLAEFAGDLDAGSLGSVVTGPAVAADSGGLLDAVRGDHALRATVSTVDGADQPAGVIATVLALVDQRQGRAGNYGFAPGADAPLPAASPAP